MTTAILAASPRRTEAPRAVSRGTPLRRPLRAAVLLIALLAGAWGDVAHAAGDAASATSPPADGRATGPAPADDRAAVATVNGQALPRRLLDVLVRSRSEPADPSVPGAPAPAPTEAEVGQALDDLVTTEVLAQAAERDGLLAQPDIAAEARLQQRTWTAQMYARQLLSRLDIPDEAIRARYAAQPPEREYKVGHILLHSEAQARAVMARLKAGQRPATLARRHSLDRQAPGGELGWLLPSQLPGALAAAVQRLEPGATLDEPVRSPAGWHVVWLTERRDLPKPPLDDMRTLLRAQLLQERFQSELARLRSEAQIEWASPVRPSRPVAAASTGSTADASPTGPTPAAIGRPAHTSTPIRHSTAGPLARPAAAPYAARPAPASLAAAGP
jgi:peptidyl-prolyl cis-trans isomerase C